MTSIYHIPLNFGENIFEYLVYLVNMTTQDFSIDLLIKDVKEYEYFKYKYEEYVTRLSNKGSALFKCMFYNTYVKRKNNFHRLMVEKSIYLTKRYDITRKEITSLPSPAGPKDVLPTAPILNDVEYTDDVILCK